MVLAVIGWFFLGLLALFLLLLVVPVTISIRYGEGELTAHVRVLFVRLKVFPMKPRPPKEKKPRAEKKPKDDEEKTKKKKEKPKKTFGQQVVFIKRLAASGMAAMKVFMHHLRIHGVQMVLPVHSEEPANTALTCGRIQRAVGTLRVVLDGRVHIRYRRLEVIPDFTGRYQRELLLACKFSFCPGIIIPMGVVFLKRYLQKRPYSKATYKRAIAQKRARQKENGAKAA